MKVFIVTILLAIAIQCNSQNVYFKVDANKFMYRESLNESFTDFGRFAGINVGVTIPGTEPGEVPLRDSDYDQYFKDITAMGAKVIRIYALHHPDFYRKLIDWNNGSDNKLYVLHGTLFPEEDFETIIGRQTIGGNLYSDYITDKMIEDVQNAVIGVYGKGSAIYRYSGPDRIPIRAEYTANIAPYLLGWVVGGEISPFAGMETNNKNPGRKHNGQFVFSKNSATPFESWIALILDELAKKSLEYNEAAPLSHTNWATTDGLSHPDEPPLPDSVEDFVEMDMTHLDENWPAGMFYNQHAYPYYPNFIPRIINEAVDPYYTYIDELRAHYNDRPLLLTETGVSTSIGVASRDHYLNRDHGQVSEERQGLIIANMTRKMIQEHDIYGILIFELYDEWFKKTWNVEDLETGKPYWLNVLSAEQKFGVYKTISNGYLGSKSLESDGNFVSNAKISHNYEYMTIEVDVRESGGYFVVGFDSSISGSTVVENRDMYTRFPTPIDCYLEINTEDDTVKFYSKSTNNLFLRAYGVWLNGVDNYYLDEHIEDILNPEKGLFYEFIQLVKTPDYYYDSFGKRINTTHERFELKFLDRNNYGNLGLFKKENGVYTIDIPWILMGYANPAYKQIYVLDKQGREFDSLFIESTEPMKVYNFYSFGGIPIGGFYSTEYDWEKWEKITEWCTAPKDGIEYIREAFSEINSLVLEPFDENFHTLCHSEENNSNELTVHMVITTISMVFLTVIFGLASVGSWLGKLCYCYGYRNSKVENKSLRLQGISFILFSGMIVLFIFEFHKRKIDVDRTYFILLALIIWDSIVLILCFLLIRWDITKEGEISNEEDNMKHAFIVACHNSSDVLEQTIRSLLTKVPPECIYIADNGSSQKEIEATNRICEEESIKYYTERNMPINIRKHINCGHSPIGNKTVAQYMSVMNLPPYVEFVTCVDDDTQLDSSWGLSKVTKYFEDDRVAVLAYPLRVAFRGKRYETELFQQIEYLIVGQVKMLQSLFGTTIFNSGAFGTYRVSILKDALKKHTTEFNGDDLQICLNIHRITSPNKYIVKTATNMVAATITPKCFFHLSQFFCIRPFIQNKKCSCNNPDLYGQRVRGWIPSQHRFIVDYAEIVATSCGALLSWPFWWLKILLSYEIILVLLEYFAVVYIAVFVRSFGLWIVDNLIIAIAINILTIILFNWIVLQKNKLKLPLEVIATQPLIYKIFLTTFYKYAGILYNIFIYSPQRNRMLISFYNIFCCGSKKFPFVPIYKREMTLEFTQHMHNMFVNNIFKQVNLKKYRVEKISPNEIVSQPTREERNELVSISSSLSLPKIEQQNQSIDSFRSTPHMEGTNFDYGRYKNDDISSIYSKDSKKSVHTIHKTYDGWQDEFNNFYEYDPVLKTYIPIGRKYRGTRL